jgi:hypothetical protein
MATNFRNTELPEKLARNPLKAHMASCLDIAEQFQGDCQFLQLNKDLSAQGRQKSMQAHLRRAIHDLRAARGPIDEMAKKLEKKEDLVKRPPLDRTDRVAADDRREARTILRSLDKGARALLLSGAGADPDCDAGKKPDMVRAAARGAIPR